MISHGVEISIAGGGADEKDKGNRALFFFSFFSFFFSFFYIIYSLLRYKKSHGALAMAKTKPMSQNELTQEISGTVLFIWGPYRSQALIRARNLNK